MQPWLTYVLIGVWGGIAAGMFGVGGGIVIVPTLVFFAGFTQHRATGTSLALLLPPIGLAAVIEYYRKGNVDITAALVMAPTMICAAWLGAYFAHFLKGPQLRMVFGVFICCVGVYLIYGAWKSMRAV